MKRRFKKLIGYIHLWLGLASGLVVFIVALTGALLTFEEEIELHVISRHHNWVKYNKGDKALPMDSLMRLGTPMLLTLSNGHDPTRIFIYRNPERSAIVGFNYEDQQGENQRGHVFINPYNGEILGLRQGNPHHRVWTILADLHYQLLLGEVGLFLVQWSTFIMLIMVISGIILWWPKNKAALKQRYKFNWKPTTRWKRKNYDLHNILGFYASWIAFFMIVTGLMWAFQWFNNGVYWLTSGGEQIPVEYPVPGMQANDSAESWPLAFSQYPQAFEAFRQQFPDIYGTSDEICVGYFASEADKIIDVSAIYDPAGLRQVKSVWANYDRIQESIISSSLDDVKHFGDAVQQSTNELHYGTYFGLPSKIATFFACLIVASLPVTGFYIWWGRKRKSTART